GLDMQCERLLLGHRRVGDRDEDRRLVVLPNDQDDRALIAPDQGGIAVAVVGDLEDDGGSAQIAGGPGTGEEGIPVGRGWCQGGGGGEPEGGEGQRVAVEVGRVDRELERLADHGDLVADRGQVGRPVRVVYRDDEALRDGEDRGPAAAVAVVGGRQGDRG